MAKAAIYTNDFVGKWPRIEEYQNSTLRYTPPKNFPEFLVSVNGRPKIIRVWITLDEVWDYRTDEYDWNYQIGVNKYVNDPNRYPYDWPRTVPSDTLFQDYLTSYCAIADEAIFNIRRYEVEVMKGLISLEKYEEVVEKVIEYYKDLCPNIVYIEATNEAEIRSFGMLKPDEVYKLYRCVYHAVRRLNAKHQYAQPLKVGGTALSEVTIHFPEWYAFLQNLSRDTDPDKMIDFYSVHTYDRHQYKLDDFYKAHNIWLEELGLPKKPIFFDEYGTEPATGVRADSLKNAAGTLVGMIQAAHYEDMHIFPWCTFHNPELQASYTQFLRRKNDTYVPTPNGHGQTFLHMLGENELRKEVAFLQREGEQANWIAATGDGKKTVILVSNPTDRPQSVDLMLKEVPYVQATITQYLVDETHNNCMTGPDTDKLHLTDRWQEVAKDGCVDIRDVLMPYGFALWVVEPFFLSSGSFVMESPYPSVVRIRSAQ